jgi:hypothetical protein
MNDIQNYVPLLAILGILTGLAGVGGWIFTTWLRVRHGYPLETSWGKPIYPSMPDETKERVKLLSTENAQLRAELGSIKDRLANVERIVTDRSGNLDREIEMLRGAAN